jgi:putative effector of murein hydrolase LrgA (UPF0299 family)
MLQAIAALLLFQLLGELIVRWTGLPLPGALAGMALLLAALIVKGRVPEPLERAANRLFRHMMLMFIPLVAGVAMHYERIAADWLPFVAACAGGAAITIAVTALTLQWLLRRSAPKVD